MNKLLFQIHRWAGIALAVFMAMWFTSGLIIMYGPNSALSPTEQVPNRELLKPQRDWISLAELLKANPSVQASNIADAKLVRLADEPAWILETFDGKRQAYSAKNGQAFTVSAEHANQIAQSWLTIDGQRHSKLIPTNKLIHINTGPQDSSVRNHQELRPFHRIGLEGESREIWVSAKTGAVVRDSTALDRALYWAGNWIHLLRPIEAVGGSGDARRLTQNWLAVGAVLASLTGLIIGWQRWRPGWFGHPTYSKRRVHPYRDVWNTYHFWVGLIGGLAALLWAFSGWINTNPFQVFSPANPTKVQLQRYQGDEAIPSVMLNWRPGQLDIGTSVEPIVELSWRRLGSKATLVGISRYGDTLPILTSDAKRSDLIEHHDILAAIRRGFSDAPIKRVSTLEQYNQYYYPRHGQSHLEKPLPVLHVELADPAETHFYVHPIDGRVLLKQDESRRAYRWLFSALHHWDFGWLYWRPLWDLWMLPLVLMGCVLGVTSVVLGVKRLQQLHQTRQKRRAKQARSTPYPASQTVASP